jgi:hypothetical protein
MRIVVQSVYMYFVVYMLFLMYGGDMPIKCECCYDNIAVQVKVTNYLVLYIYLKNIKMSIG